MQLLSLLAHARAGARAFSRVVAAFTLSLAGIVQAQAQVTDNFNRADGGLGASWAKNTIAATLQIAGGRVQAPAGEYAESLHTSTVSGTAQFSEVQHTSGLAAGVINLVVRAREYANGWSGDGYIGQINGFEATWKIIRVDNDIETIIASGALAFANNDTYSFEANGSTLTLKRNGATLGSATSSTYTTGEAGLGLYSTGGLLVDNWRGGGLAVADTQAPSVPSGVSATSSGTNQVSLAWSTSSDNVAVTGYRVERCQGSGCSSYTQIATPTSASYKDSSLTPGTSYAYRVRARDAAGNLSNSSSVVTAVTQAAGGLQVSDSFNRTDGNLGANWTANRIAATLQLVGGRIQTPAGDYAEALHTAAALGGAQFSEIQHTSGLAAGVINLVVRARDFASGGSGDGYIGQLNGFESAWKIIRVDNDVETIIASGPLTYANGDYYYFEANGSTLTLKKNSVTLGTATSTTYTAGNAGVGLYSTGGLLADNWRAGDLTAGDTQAPSTPATLTANPAASSQINLSWGTATDNVGLTAYLLERCPGATCTNFAQIASLASTSYNDTGLAASTTYRYRVRARDAANNSGAYSAIASAATPAAGSAVISDNFNRADGGLGTNWSTNRIGPALQISGNRAQTPAGDYAESLHGGTVGGAAQFSEVQLVGGMTAGVINLVVRAREYATGGAGDGYIGQLNGFQSAWKIIRVDNDVETVLASGPLTYANNDTYYFEANGSALTLKRNGATLGSATNAAYASGEAGLGLYSTGGLLVDNWRGGGVATGDKQAPTAPATLSATTSAANQIVLAWNASTDNLGVTGYLLERCQGAGCATFTQVATPTATGHNDTGLSTATSYTYRVRARDAAGNLGSYSTTATAITAASGNRAPLISGTPATSVAAGQVYSFKPTVSDADGDAVTLTIVNKPAWATFQGGVLSGTPTAAGTWSGIEIWAADARARTMLPAFSIATTSANGAPKISGTPATSVIAGQAYAFTPTASDPEGNTLYFQIANKPAWATFNTVNGALSGTPSAAQVGVYGGIAITVTDGVSSVALPAFTVTVASPPVVNRNATLSWMPPTQNIDGSTLLDLAGYRIYYGTNAGNLGQVIDLPIAQATSYVVRDLSPGTFYFAITAYTAGGLESAQSNVASKTIQ